MVPWRTDLLRPHAMRIVEANEPLTVWAVQRQRIIEPMRLLGGYRHPRDDKTHPMATIRIDDERLSVKIEQGIERPVAGLRHTGGYHTKIINSKAASSAPG